jgi:hypothetical protein
MTTIPPNWLGSIIQSQGAQERTGRAKDAEIAEEARRTGGGAFSEKLQDVIENNDRDVEVFSDAEGTGSQGTPFAESEEEQLEKEDQNDDEDGDHPTGLDIEA